MSIPEWQNVGIVKLLDAGIALLSMHEHGPVWLYMLFLKLILNYLMEICNLKKHNNEQNC